MDVIQLDFVMTVSHLDYYLLEFQNKILDNKVSCDRELNFQNKNIRLTFISEFLEITDLKLIIRVFKVLACLKAWAMIIIFKQHLEIIIRFKS